MQVLRIGPPTASLQRRLEVAGRGGSLLVLVEIWGMADERGRQAVERRLAEGMLNFFERREGGVTARLRASMQAGDRWLRRVREAAGPEENLSSLGAGASLLWAGEGEAILAQAGPALAFSLDLPPERQTEVSPAEIPRALRHPAASPWLRRGIDRLHPDALWPPLGMGDPDRLELHWSHWSFPPGATALLAPSRAAELLRREVVGRILGEVPELARRHFDEVLPDGLPAILVHHPRPPEARPPVEPEEDLDLTTRYDALSWDTAAHPLPVDAEGEQLPLPGVAADGRPTVSGGDDRPRSSVATSYETAGVTGGFDAGEVDVVETHDIDYADDNPRAFPVDPDRVSATAGQALFGLRQLGMRLARGTARVLVSTLPQREREGADSYAVESARLAAAAALLLPLAVLMLMVLMSRRGPLPEDAAVGAASNPAGEAALEAPAGESGPADPAELRIQRPSLVPAAQLSGAEGASRRLVVAGGAAWVMDVDADRVDRIELQASEGGGLADPAPVEALSQRWNVGETVVGALEDLFLLPAPDDGPDAGQGPAVVALDAAGNLWRVDGAAPGGLARADTPPWTTVGHAAGYEGRLYALDRSTGQIYRYAAAGGAWPAFELAGESWLGAPADLATAIDMAIDGSVYVLGRDGRIQKFAGGQPVSFQVSGLPQPLVEPVALHALPPEGDLLLADRGGRRILVLGPDGAFRAQLLRPAQALAGDDGGLDGLQAVWWDPGSQMLYVLAGSTLWMGPYAGPDGA